MRASPKSTRNLGGGEGPCHDNEGRIPINNGRGGDHVADLKGVKRYQSGKGPGGEDVVKVSRRGDPLLGGRQSRACKKIRGGLSMKRGEGQAAKARLKAKGAAPPQTRGDKTR